MVDLLADALDATRTRGVVFARVRFGSPWALRCDAAPLVGFHVVARGACALRLDGTDELVDLHQGDVALVTRGDGHVLHDRHEVPPVPLGDLVAATAPGTIGQLRVGGDGPETVLVCGGYLFHDPAPHPLLAGLPPLVHLRGDEVGAATRLVVDQLVAESTGAAVGSRSVANRLVDVLLVHVLRGWLARDEATTGGGWLAGLRDPDVARALELVHASHAEDLALDDLADAANLSLTAFKRRFTRLVGVSPGAYLARVRVDAAARLLRDTELTVGEVGRAVGYRSEPGFSRAFTRLRGVSPSAHREATREHPPPDPLAPALPPP